MNITRYTTQDGTRSLDMCNMCGQVVVRMSHIEGYESTNTFECACSVRAAAVAEALLAPLQAVREAKEQAILEMQFELAAELRHIERDLMVQRRDGGVPVGMISYMAQPGPTLIAASAGKALQWAKLQQLLQNVQVHAPS